jgi:hypothetical protein
MKDQQKDKLLRIAIAGLAADAQGGTPIDEQRIVSTVHDYAIVAGKGLNADDLQAVIREISKRFNVWTGSAQILVGDDPGHHEWISTKRDQIAWSFWSRFRQHVEGTLPPNVVVELDESTTTVLGQLEDPGRSGSWRRQGLIVGHVQSGKTGHYTGLICKAADAGYKVVIVLSGIHNSLRAQTQIRLDEGFLGYARAFGDATKTRVPMGVGLLDSTPVADSVTTRDERGDFSQQKAQGFQIHAGGNVLLFVVKKNAKVLKNLIEWAKLSAKKPVGEGRNVVGDVPLLVVDDEADQASVDTNVQAFDEKTGAPDPDHDPKAINRLIRILLETFERRAYVGYTATPFANVFVHPDGYTKECGDDLFPKHFIINLSAPNNYFGPTRVFGATVEGLPDHGAVPSRIRFVDDSEEWVPASHKSGLVPRVGGKDDVPASLHCAIRSFILACAARRARGQETQHKSMLVHVTRFTAVQSQVHLQVRKVVETLKTRWRARKSTSGDALQAELQRMWEVDFAQTAGAHGGVHVAWSLIEQHVWPVLDMIKVMQINAKASDALIYEEHKKGGLHVIAVGGDKLSRGLTLEGLTVSYFLRSSRMYDTLMQMGRWFGYRPGYEDLCRLYLTQELAEWYGHITEASDELRAEFDRMVLQGSTPNEYGLRVRTHPVLAITGKLRPGLPTITTSLSATPFEPTVLIDSPSVHQKNWENTSAFLESLGVPFESPVRRYDPPPLPKRGEWAGAVSWRDVRGEKVLAFLKQFAFADKFLTRTPSGAVRDYIADRLKAGELTEWTVVALGKASEGVVGDEIAPINVTVAGRELLSVYRSIAQKDRKDIFTTKRLGSPRDESIDLTESEWIRVYESEKAIKADPQKSPEMTRGRLIREYRPKERGLLILYLLTPDPTRVGKAGARSPLVAPYISFPFTPNAKAVSYKVGIRYWEEELGGVE